MSFPVQEGGGVGGGGGMWGSLGSIQVGAACGIRSVKIGLLLLPGEKEGRHSSTNAHTPELVFSYTHSPLSLSLPL